MSTFHPFPRLPAELRLQIWETTAEPRTVDIRRPRRFPEPLGRLISPTAIPAILQTCREARYHGVYVQIFFEVDAQQGATEQRYVWLNFDTDMVDIGTSGFRYYKHIASSIKRLKFERENTDEYFFHSECQQLRNFVNVEEIHVVCADGFWAWGGVIDDGPHPWPCAPANILFIVGDEVKRGLELEEWFQSFVEIDSGEDSSNDAA